MGAAHLYSPDSINYKVTSITIASEPDYPPYCIVDKNGNADGFSVDLFKAAAKVVGIEAEIKIGVWDQIKQDLAEGRIDALPLVGRTPEREEHFDFTMPYLRLHGAIFIHKRTKGIESVEDLKDKTIAVMKGDNAEEYVRRSNISSSIIATHTFEEAFRKLNTGEVDAVVIQKVVGIELLKRMNLKSIVPLNVLIPEFRQDFCFAVQKGNTALLDKLNEGLSIVIAKKTFNELHHKWFGPSINQEISLRDILIIGSKLLVPLVIFSFLISILILRRIVKLRTKALHEAIAKHEQVNQLLTSQKQLLEKMEMVSKIGGWGYEVEAKTLSWTEGVYHIYGVPLVEFNPSDINAVIDIFHPNDKDELLSAFRLAIVNGEPFDLELKFFNNQRVEKWVWISGQVEYFNNRVVRVYGSIMDITEGKQSEEALLEQEEIFKNFMEHSPVYVFFKDEEIRPIRLSKNYEKMIGKPLSEIIGKTMDDLFPSDLAKRMIADDKKVLNDCKTIVIDEEFNGRYYTTIKFPIVVGGKRYLAGYTIDITDRKKAEEELSRSRAFLSELVENSGALIYAKSISGHYELVNKKWELVTGKSREETIGKTDEELFPGDIGVQFRTNDLEVMKLGEVLEKEEIMEGDESPRFFLSIKFPLYSEKGEVSGMCGISTEITDRKLANEELISIKNNLEKIVEERTKELAEQVNKLDKSQKAMLYMIEDLNSLTSDLKKEGEKLEISNKELEAFSYSVSHDLRAPLRAIDGFSRMLIEDYANVVDKEGIRLLNVVRENTQRMDKLISDLLTLSKVTRTQLSLSEIDMAGMARSMYHEVLNNFDSSKIKIDIKQMPRVLADTTLIRQVWQNLIGNALKYSSPKELMIIEIGGEKLEDENIYYIKDNGVGFNPEYKSKIFETFQRLHRADEFEGTGIGLSVVQRIVSRHGGRVWAESVEGEGATFWFSMPSSVD